MCVAFFTLDHPDYALVLCSNRDEHLSRPTEPARFHRTFGEHDVLSGIDVQGGGTWLGLARTGKLALLTNVTEPYNTYARSRGVLLTSFLSAPPSQDVWCRVPPDTRLAGFNLLLLQVASSFPALSFDARYVTNHGGGGRIACRALTDAERRCGGISNGVDGQGADAWPKVQHGVRAFAALLDGLAADTSDAQLTERLFDLLTWRSSQPPRDRSELRHTIEAVPLVLEDGAWYGTRLATVVLVKRNGHVLFTERDRWTWSGQGLAPNLADPELQRVFRFEIQGSSLSSSSSGSST